LAVNAGDVDKYTQDRTASRRLGQVQVQNVNMLDRKI
jgi:hypothetical protein